MVVMRCLRRARFDVPGDMSILGFDGLAMGELLSPQLASIGTPNREIGCAAWRRLMARIDGADDGESLSLTLPHMLRKGATVAALSGASGAALPAHPAA
jgi:DNA-binding LacI/PurR family transcriptional regulator